MCVCLYVCVYECVCVAGVGVGGGDELRFGLTVYINCAAECIQCGNYDNGIACTDVELNQAVSSPCDDTKTSFCMTDVIVDSNSKVLTYKRYVLPWTEKCPVPNSPYGLCGRKATLN